MVTWIEVADTAVKIGLSAAIAGVSAYYLTKRSHAYEFERDRMKRRERLLEKTVEEFELAYQALSAKYERVLGLARVVTDEKFRINAHNCIHNSSDFPRIHIVESHLLLLGLTKEAEMLMRFRQIAGEFEKLALPQDRSHPDPQVLNLKLEALFQQRVAIYNRLAEFYDDPRTKASNA